MNELKEDYSLPSMCTALDVSSSGYYAHKEGLTHPSERAKEDAVLKERIKEIHEESRENYGSPRILLELKKEGFNPTRKRVARLMREASIEGVQKKAFKPATTNSKHDNPISPNHLQDMDFPTKPNEVWVTDTTCISVVEGWLYLAVVLDLFNREIVGWAVSEYNDTAVVLKAMDNAIEVHGHPEVHHSDRGSTYTSNAYRKLLSDYEVLSSMSTKGYCYDNAFVESLFSTLKAESKVEQLGLNRSEATDQVFEYIEAFYNTHRIHTALGCSPQEYASWNC